MKYKLIFNFLLLITILILLSPSFSFAEMNSNRYVISEDSISGIDELYVEYKDSDSVNFLVSEEPNLDSLEGADEQKEKNLNSPLFLKYVNDNFWLIFLVFVMILFLTLSLSKIRNRNKNVL